MPGAASAAEVTDALGLAKLRGARDWYVQGTCATSGDGLYEGFAALSDGIRKAQKEKRAMPF